MAAILNFYRHTLTIKYLTGNIFFYFSRHPNERFDTKKPLFRCRISQLEF